MEAVGYVTVIQVAGNVCPLVQAEKFSVFNNFSFTVLFSKSVCFKICPSTKILEKDVPAPIYADNFRMLEL